MLTQTEMQRILDQINTRFDYMNKKIESLEKKVVEVEKPKRITASKKVEETS